ncbi:hypothetical protein [Hyphomicrobium sp.]|uniref:hypothetical protein n=1 Tax=Hyphomicrobium sp. TaxID=82 RepID=UPI002E307DAA|nr:hypothetical protein [Hyphomicrobium sp.]HEX2842504.1 hypothetical protein [Hyphomicrobium sp.]
MAEQQTVSPNGFASVSVYWIGHSLINTKVQTEEGTIDLMSLVSSFAKTRGLDYAMGDHTFSGIPLSAQWRGKPHSYERDASEMVSKREAFEREAGRYDTVVLTEALPLQASFANEFSTYYLRKFYCTIKQANPAARVFLYESWINLHGTDPYAGYPPMHEFDWGAEMVAQRGRWEALADGALQPRVPQPGWLARLGLTSMTDGGCVPKDPILIVPVGQALISLRDRLAEPRPGDRFDLPDGRRLAFSDLFENPYVNWPRNWPTRNANADELEAQRQALVLRDPTRPLDDIHPTAIGIYMSALVHFATLYGQNPVGLSAPSFLGEPLAETLQCIAWETVVSTARSGVEGEARCG